MPATPKLSITRSIFQGDLNPVGMIVQSVLTEVQFQALNGTSWVLMDGRSVTGSTYATVTGSSTIPDARGMVLRGKNNGRSDGNQDPGGERAVGNLQNQATAKNGLTASASSSSVTGTVGGSDGAHTHRAFYNATTRTFNGDGGTEPATGIWDGGLDTSRDDNITSTNSGHGHGFSLTAAAQTVTVNAGDAETRMRNIAVNHFIKIN